MGKHFLLIVILFLSAPLYSEEILELRVKDKNTTFPAVQSLVVDDEEVYWDEKALETLFGATPKEEGENLVILCKDALCVPFYRDDPRNIVIERKGRPFLLASQAAETFGYKRLEIDRGAGEMRMYKTPAPQAGEAPPSPMKEFNLPDLSGDKITLEKLKGKKTIFLIWAPWNKPDSFLRSWNRLMKDRKENIRLALIAETIEGRERLEPWLSMLSPRPLCLIDAGFSFTIQYDIKQLPVVMIMDEQGNLLTAPRNIDPSDENFQKNLDSWIKGEKPAKQIFEPQAKAASDASYDHDESIQRFELASALLASGKKKEAVKEYERAADEFPENQIFREQLRALKEPEKVYPTPSPSPGDAPDNNVTESH